MAPLEFQLLHRSFRAYPPSQPQNRDGTVRTANSSPDLDPLWLFVSFRTTSDALPLEVERVISRDRDPKLWDFRWGEVAFCFKWPLVGPGLARFRSEEALAIAVVG